MSFMTPASALEAAPSEQAVGVEIHVRALALRANTTTLNADTLLENAHFLMFSFQALV